MKTAAPSGPVQGGTARMSSAVGIHPQAEESTTCQPQRQSLDTLQGGLGERERGGETSRGAQYGKGAECERREEGGVLGRRRGSAAGLKPELPQPLPR